MVKVTITTDVISRFPQIAVAALRVSGISPGRLSPILTAVDALPETFHDRKVEDISLVLGQITGNP